MNDTEMVQDTIDGVEAMAKEFVKTFDEQFQGTPYGLNKLSDEEHAAWFEKQVAAYPPEAFNTVDGQVVIGSPWVLMLPYTENGKAELRRYMKTRGIG